ncbi:MAG: thioesterase family protein [Candidatus Zixiibacteriota bacterium]
MAAFKDYYTIQLHDTDAAGILFFANQLKIVHNVYESLMKKIGFGFRDRFEKQDFYIPIVHAETDFFTALRDSDTVEIQVEVAALGETSFTLAYSLHLFDGTTAGTAKTVHVTIDPKTWKKTPLPPGFREALESLRTE